MKVMVMMSGGVDSSVAAALVRDAGHDVVGVTLKLWGGESDSGCCSVSDVDDARRAADALGVDHHVFDFSDSFTRHVVEPYVQDHQVGRTPNPCIECNRHLKFAAVDERARSLGFDAVATGHHARIVLKEDGTYRIARGADPAKDQSYVLHMLDQEHLARTLLPIGHMTKTEVRTLAQRFGMRTATKPDSQDVCFITSKQGRESFLAQRTTLTPATVLDQSGKELGSVGSAQMVTIGQRRGLGLPGGTAPQFVLDVDVEGQRVVVGERRDLRADSQPFERLAWSSDQIAGEVLVQCSAHGIARPAVIEMDPLRDGYGRIVWSEPQRRIAPGQSLVIYVGDEVAGGAMATR